MKFTQRGKVNIFVSWIPKQNSSTGVSEEDFYPKPFDEDDDEDIFEKEANLSYLSSQKMTFFASQKISSMKVYS